MYSRRAKPRWPWALAAHCSYVFSYCAPIWILHSKPKKLRFVRGCLQRSSRKYPRGELGYHIGAGLIEGNPDVRGPRGISLKEDAPAASRYLHHALATHPRESRIASVTIGLQAFAGSNKSR